MDKRLEQLRESYKLIESGDSITLWHGGKLADSYRDTISHKKGRWEYGPGLYLTSHYEVVKKYIGGSRRLYKIVVKKGRSLEETSIKWESVVGFIDSNIPKSKREDLKDSLEKYNKDGLIRATYLVNLIINLDSLPSSRTNVLREYLVSEGIDYSVVKNAFGWGDTMLILFNMDNIVSKQIVKSSDIDDYDLGTEFGGE